MLPKEQLFLQINEDIFSDECDNLPRDYDFSKFQWFQLSLYQISISSGKGDLFTTFSYFYIYVVRFDQVSE